MIRIGIICPADIATRRFLPSLIKLPSFEFVGVAIANQIEWENSTEESRDAEMQKAVHIKKQFGGKVFKSYSEIIDSNEIDALYLPLPPALHFKWAKAALLKGKHVLVEKPCTTGLKETQELIDIARHKNLAIHENYMFAFHNQIESINNIVKSGQLGDIRLYRISFGFPQRELSDFRYNKSLGGGALLDCGGYTLKYATILLGNSINIDCAKLNYIDGFEVDIYGSALLTNSKGNATHIAFGMDNSYKCELEIWGSLGQLFTDRILTAPAGFIPKATIKTKGNITIVELPEDDTFEKSILHFKNCISDANTRIKNFDDILKQAELVTIFEQKSRINKHGK